MTTQKTGPSADQVIVKMHKVQCCRFHIETLVRTGVCHLSDNGGVVVAAAAGETPSPPGISSGPN